METLFSLSGSRVLDAKSCESIVSVMPVRFARLEALFLSSESICKHSEETKLEISETLKVRVLSSGRNLATAGREDPTPTPTLQVRVLTSLRSFRLVLQCVLQHVRT